MYKVKVIRESTMAKRGRMIYWLLAGCLVLSLMYMCWRCQDFPNDMQLAEKVCSDSVPVDDFESRRAHVEKICLKYQTTLLGTGYSSSIENKSSPFCKGYECTLFIDKTRRLAFCAIAKVASTSVKTLFAPLLNVSNPGGNRHTLHTAFQQTVPRTNPHFFRSRADVTFQNYTTAIFVRHPFERLVSTYVEKALLPRSEVGFFYDFYWDKLIGTDDPDRRVTFPEFVDMVLSQPVHNWDNHWAPYYMTCEPCAVKYDIVGKLETAARDMQLFYDRMHVDSQMLPAVNRRKDLGPGYRKNAKDYFAEISFTQIMRLYESYFLDFELFGYEFRDYLH